MCKLVYSCYLRKKTGKDYRIISKMLNFDQTYIEFVVAIATSKMMEMQLTYDNDNNDNDNVLFSSY